MPDAYTYAFFDLETCGLNPLKHPIIAACFYVADGGDCVVVRGEEEKVLTYVRDHFLGPYIAADSDRSRLPMHLVTFNGLKYDLPFLVVRLARSNSVELCWDLFRRLSFCHSDLKQFARLQTGSWQRCALEDVVDWYRPRCDLFWARPVPRGWDDLSRAEWALMSEYQAEEMRAMVWYARRFFPVSDRVFAVREVDLF